MDEMRSLYELRYRPVITMKIYGEERITEMEHPKDINVRQVGGGGYVIDILSNVLPGFTHLKYLKLFGF